MSIPDSTVVKILKFLYEISGFIIQVAIEAKFLQNCQCEVYPATFVRSIKSSN